MFCEWAINNGYKKSLTIDRIDNNKGYFPENCRWVNYTTQCRNRKNTLKFKINNIEKPLAEWCEIYNINYSMVFKRLKRNWPIEKALSISIKHLGNQV